MGEEFKKYETIYTNYFNEPTTPDKKLILSGQNQDLKLLYDINTSQKTFKIYSGGMEHFDGVNTYNTPLPRLCLMDVLTKSLLVPPDNSTLKVGNRLYLENGVNNLQMSYNSINSTTAVSFNNLPTCAVVPSSASQLVNKAYVDGIIGTSKSIIGGFAKDIKKSLTVYFGLFSGSFNDFSASNNELDCPSIIPYDCSVKNLYINLSNSAGSVGASYTFTVRKNGVDTSLSVVVNDVSTSGSNIVNNVSFLQGDNLTIGVVPSSPTIPNDNLEVRWTMGVF